MRRLDFSRFGFLTVVSILSLGFASGCGGGDDSGDDDGGSGGTGATGGSSGAGGSSGGGADAITWTDMGWVDVTANTYKIQGPWYSYNDCANAEPANLPCTMSDPALVGPDMKPGWSATPEKVCTKGTAVKVALDPNTGMPAYSLQWGAGIALDLNSTGGDAAVKNPYDADAAGIKGFMFDIITNSTPPMPAELRVNFKAPLTGDNSHFVTALLPAANYQVLFADAAQGPWVTNTMDLPTNALESVQFQIFTNETAPKPFDFCVSNMRVIKK